MPHPHRLHRLHRLRRLGAASGPCGLALLLAGCGGGVSLGLGDFFDEAPTVALTAAVGEGAPGQVVRLAAAATDDSAVVSVAFFQVEADGGLTRLGSDASAPYQWDVVLPATPGVAVRYLARATDDAGQDSDGAAVDILVR